MAELYRGYRIFLDADHELREVKTPIAFPFDHVLDTRSAHGCSPGFENKDPKFFVRLTQDRKMWLMGSHRDFIDQWEAYLAGDDESCDCPACASKTPFPCLYLN